MELVTLAHVTFFRVGSASDFGFRPHREVQRGREVADREIDTLRALVVEFAVELGEDRESLKRMWQETVLQNYGQFPPGSIVFNIHGPRTQYGSPYAVCYAHPALKVGQRYFRLEEVSL